MSVAVKDPKITHSVPPVTILRDGSRKPLMQRDILAIFPRIPLIAFLWHCYAGVAVIAAPFFLWGAISLYGLLLDLAGRTGEMAASSIIIRMPPVIESPGIIITDEPVADR